MKRAVASGTGSALFESWRGKYADSPRAISERLAQRYPGLDQVWVAAEQTEVPTGVRRVRRHSPEHFARLFSANFLVSNDVVTQNWVTRPDQTYVQTWHGTPLKTIGHDEVDPMYDARAHYRRMDRDVRRWDVLLSTGPECTAMFRSAFRYDGEVLESGLPRNDVLRGAEAGAIGRRTREELGVPDGARVALWAPTWRDDVSDGSGGFGHPGGLDVDEFVARSDESTVLLVRMHSVVSSRVAGDRGGRVIDVSDHPEIAHLYLASDALVSDYSSTVYDFAVTGRPIVLLAHDLEHYRTGVRRLYHDYQEWAPGPVVTTTSDLVDALGAVWGDGSPSEADRWTATRRRFVERFCAMEDGRATDRVIDAVFSPRRG